MCDYTCANCGCNCFDEGININGQNYCLKCNPKERTMDNYKTPVKIWDVKKTACFPCIYKVYKVSYKGYIEDNATYHYFRTIEEAYAEANKRNKQAQEKKDE